MCRMWTLAALAWCRRWGASANGGTGTAAATARNCRQLFGTIGHRPRRSRFARSHPQCDRDAGHCGFGRRSMDATSVGSRNLHSTSSGGVHRVATHEVEHHRFRLPADGLPAGGGCSDHVTNPGRPDAERAGHRPAGDVGENRRRRGNSAGGSSARATGTDTSPGARNSDAHRDTNAGNKRSGGSPVADSSASLESARATHSGRRSVLASKRRGGGGTTLRQPAGPGGSQPSVGGRAEVALRQQSGRR